MSKSTTIPVDLFLHLLTPSDNLLSVAEHLQDKAQLPEQFREAAEEILDDLEYDVTIDGDHPHGRPDVEIDLKSKQGALQRMKDFADEIDSCDESMRRASAENAIRDLAGGIGALAPSHLAELASERLGETWLEPIHALGAIGNLCQWLEGNDKSGPWLAAFLDGAPGKMPLDMLKDIAGELSEQVAKGRYEKVAKQMETWMPWLIKQAKDNHAFKKNLDGLVIRDTILGNCGQFSDCALSAGLKVDPNKASWASIIKGNERHHDTSIKRSDLGKMLERSFDQLTNQWPKLLQVDSNIAIATTDQKKWRGAKVDTEYIEGGLAALINEMEEKDATQWRARIQEAHMEQKTRHPVTTNTGRGMRL